MQITFDALRHKNVSEAIGPDSHDERLQLRRSPTPCDNQMETWHGMGKGTSRGTAISRFRDQRRALPGDRFSVSSAPTDI